MPAHRTVGFHHVALNARDFDKSVAFYTDVLGATPTVLWNDAPNRGIMLDLGEGNYIEIFEKPGLTRGTEPDSIIHFAIRTNDTAGLLERVRQAGAEITVEPKEVTLNDRQRERLVPIKVAFFKGPDGEVVELFENNLT